jgi:type III pantothenate kinase
LIKINLLKLIIDIGNTRIKLALFLEKKIVRSQIVEEFSVLSINSFCKNDKFSSSIISSVRPLNKKEKDLVNSMNSVVLDKNTPLPIKSNYKSSVSGNNSDRISSVIGASYLFPNKNIWVFDAGTCLTMDFIDKEKIYHGGRITLGLNMRYRALNHFTSTLPMLSMQKDSFFKGNNTKDSIISGVQQGILSEVRTLISDYRKQKNDFIVVFTGGDYLFFEKELKSSIFADPYLVLKGLNEILDFNE